MGEKKYFILRVIMNGVAGGDCRVEHRYHKGMKWWMREGK